MEKGKSITVDGDGYDGVTEMVIAWRTEGSVMFLPSS